MYWPFKASALWALPGRFYSDIGFSTYYKGLINLFSAKRFRIHRMWGLLYLLQFTVVLVREALSLPPIAALYWTLPLTGIIQSVIACCTFTFLPKEDGKLQGYYHKKLKAMSYDFILENVYFAGLLLFQSLYFSFPVMRSNPVFLPIEVVFVFFPYHTVRNFFPKSSYRISLKDTKDLYPRVVKTFYIVAKHFSGYFMNYLIFLGIFGNEPILQWALVRRLLILGGWGTTISMFLQTLKFKKYISVTAAIILYAGSFPLFFLGYAALMIIAFEQVWLTAITTVGLIVNFGPRWGQIVWQSLVCCTLFYLRLYGVN